MALPPRPVILFQLSLSSLILVALISNISAIESAPLSEIKFCPRLSNLSDELLVKSKASHKLESY